MAKLVSDNGTIKVWEYEVPAHTRQYRTWHCHECGRDNIIGDEYSVMVCMCKYE